MGGEGEGRQQDRGLTGGRAWGGVVGRQASMWAHTGVGRGQGGVVVSGVKAGC